MILAFGAAGDFAGSVIPAPAARGARVRAFVRKPEQAKLVRGRSATEVVTGDLRDRAALGERSRTWAPSSISPQPSFPAKLMWERMSWKLPSTPVCGGSCSRP
ncbi:NAD(P)H-binding protein [Mesorhizobium tamadayense]|uniref:NAD(P)H-binding protein n=1 Tax=Mesorhizobium tamadayense TaxID=425306 RepID=UPI003CCB4DBB